MKLASITSLLSFLFDILLHEPEVIESKSNKLKKRISVAENLDPIFISEDFYKGKPNPHAWISPKRGIVYVDILVDSLSELRPSKRTLFEKYGKIYKDKLSKIDKEFSLFINNLNKERRLSLIHI